MFYKIIFLFNKLTKIIFKKYFLRKLKLILKIEKVKKLLFQREKNYEQH